MVNEDDKLTLIPHVLEDGLSEKIRDKDLELVSSVAAGRSSYHGRIDNVQRHRTRSGGTEGVGGLPQE